MGEQPDAIDQMGEMIQAANRDYVYRWRVTLNRLIRQADEKLPFLRTHVVKILDKQQVAEFEALMLSEGKSVAHFCAFEILVPMARARAVEAIGPDRIVRSNQRHVEIANGAYVKFMKMALDGASCDHVPVLVLESPFLYDRSPSEATAAYESLFIPTRFRGQPPMIVLSGRLLLNYRTIP